MWGLLMFYLVKCSHFYLDPASYYNFFFFFFEADVRIRKPASTWKDGARLGPTPHSVQEVPQKHNDTLTDMGLSALWLRPKHCSPLLLIHFSLVLMAVSLKPWREGLYTIIGPCLCCFYLSPIPLPETPDKSIWFYSPKPQALHGHPSSIHARHDKAYPCENSLLTLPCQVDSVSLTDLSLFWEWLHHKDIKKDFKAVFFFFSKAGNSNCPKKHYLRHHSLGTSDVGLTE